jgi:hypothetical protein
VRSAAFPHSLPDQFHRFANGSVEGAGLIVSVRGAPRLHLRPDFLLIELRRFRDRNHRLCKTRGEDRHVLYVADRLVLIAEVEHGDMGNAKALVESQETTDSASPPPELPGRVPPERERDPGWRQSDRLSQFLVQLDTANCRATSRTRSVPGTPVKSAVDTVPRAAPAIWPAIAPMVSVSPPRSFIA